MNFRTGHALNADPCSGSLSWQIVATGHFNADRGCSNRGSIVRERRPLGKSIGKEFVTTTAQCRHMPTSAVSGPFDALFVATRLKGSTNPVVTNSFPIDYRVATSSGPGCRPLHASACTYAPGCFRSWHPGNRPHHRAPPCYVLECR
jgi:hypothetical protein